MSKVSLNFNGEIRSKSDICFIVWLQGGSEIANDLVKNKCGLECIIYGNLTKNLL